MKHDNKTLLVSIRTAFGKTIIDPENELAHAFCELVKQETLTTAQVDIIKSLGYVVRVKQPKAVSL